MKANMDKINTGKPAEEEEKAMEAFEPGTAEEELQDFPEEPEEEPVQDAQESVPEEEPVPEEPEAPVQEEAPEDDYPLQDATEEDTAPVPEAPAEEEPSGKKGKKDKKSKKDKKNKKQKDPDKKRPVLPWIVLGCLVAALAVYGAAIHIQAQILSAYDKGTVYTASASMAAGDVMKGDEAAGKVAPIEIAAGAVPADAVTDPAQLADSAARYDIEPGTILCLSMFETVDDMVAGMKEPVIAGFRSEDIYQVVGGVLRAGDTISIYTIDNVAEIGTAEYVGTLRWDNVRVQEVFDSSGIAISSIDDATPASRVNVYMDKGEVEEFYAKLAQGSLRVVVHCD